MKTKVFCVGFHKTGTTSLGDALKILGYRVTGPDAVMEKDIANKVSQITRGLAEQFDAFQDNPWPLVYKDMDQRYPGSKFILMIRSPESWIKSQVDHFGKRETPMRRWIYGVGCPEGNEDIYLDRYHQHNQEVLDYFKNRPADFLLMDFSKGHGWNELCSFLGEDIPDQDFPHANNKAKRKSTSKSLVYKFKTILFNLKQKL